MTCYSAGSYLINTRDPFAKPSRKLFSYEDQPSGYFLANVSNNTLFTSGSVTIDPLAANDGPSGLPTAILAFVRPAWMRLTRCVVTGDATHTAP